jgi:hypothetical protein
MWGSVTATENRQKCIPFITHQWRSFASISLQALVSSSVQLVAITCLESPLTVSARAKREFEGA